MQKLCLAVLASVALTTVAAAQPYPVMVRPISVPNTTGAGSAVLDADVHFPSNSAQGVPLQAAGGLPVVLFLHGYGQIGSDYAAIGDHLASNGYAAVLLNTAQFSFFDLEDDARAMFDAIAAENTTPGGFFENVFDMTRIGLMGHSMGGSVVAFVLQDNPGQPSHNPGYRCGLALAPVNPQMIANGIDVRVPVGIVSGAGDVITPPAQHAEVFYGDLAPDQGLKFHYAMGTACGHMNIAGLDPTSPAVFLRTRRIAVGFFDQFLDEFGWRGLESVLGSEGAGDPVLQHLDRTTVVPQMWADRNLTIGQVTNIRVVSEPGFIGLAASASLAPALPTPWGNVLVDTSTSFLLAASFVGNDPYKLSLPVPNAPLLVGAPFAVQCAGATASLPFYFGSAMSFVIE